MRLHRVRGMDLVPLEMLADLVGGEVEGGVAFGAVSLDVVEEALGQSAQGVANQEAEVGGGKAAHLLLMPAAVAVGQGNSFAFCS